MKLGVCVPYRNREAHLREFIPKVGQYLQNRGIDFCMYFCHQTDDKLFNRGATKNIAAKFAFEDGCDYIVWHDIDMIPEEGGGADYSYPAEHPVHIATQISQMNYELKYFEYFGGAVLFTKEQVERTNGYSNDYWDWGMEDDDLFWRCYLEGMVDNKVCLELPNCKYLHFTGQDSYAKISPTRELRNFTGNSHTISILCRAFQQPEKNPIFLIGDRARKYVEYPVMIIPGYDYGFQFNNSKAMSLQFWNTFNNIGYMWIKRYDAQWSWLTGTFDADKKVARFYLNGNESDSRFGDGSPSPLGWEGKLKVYGGSPIYLGTTPSVPREDSRRFFKGDIAGVKIWNRCLDPQEIKEEFKNLNEEGLLFSLDFNKELPLNFQMFNVEEREEDIKVPSSILPYRKPGRFTCLPHIDEGLVGGKWAKGETTARNERRYQIEMQQGKINYKDDGIAQVKYRFKLVGIDQLTPWAKMINVTL